MTLFVKSMYDKINRSWERDRKIHFVVKGVKNIIIITLRFTNDYTWKEIIHSRNHKFTSLKTKFMVLSHFINEKSREFTLVLFLFSTTLLMYKNYTFQNIKELSKYENYHII